MNSKRAARAAVSCLPRPAGRVGRESSGETCAAAVVLQLENVFRVVERFRDAGEAHGLDAGKRGVILRRLTMETPEHRVIGRAHVVTHFPRISDDSASYGVGVCMGW
jgi:hypothetical protein